MNMFKKEEGEIKEGETETIIGPSVKVEGDFHGEGSVVVEGQVSGTLRTNQNLRIGANAKIKADIQAANVLIAGEVRGNLQIKEKAELKSTAKVTGDITTKVISIETGAVLNGKCTSGNGIGEVKESPKPKIRNNRNNNLKKEEF
ncbi:MAG: cell shape determination protein CcmA [Candidatus Kerfeldbacteria bacterium CG08_land_8_20_14_0_20_40_16]|uniref:Cell shape determination protein CcmA n=1 Tax=Candidatus Kerfeldbacteria bacterium CG08_land_8_20_14_0_20_40_16 TaxID=2014244 RepID=A0A2H0YUK3_9BACT|nr:MAG: cell shape determination protein CcmA [Candidatus Kerfeldbacteria bacterium CG08_land_8_20_14_0_20_40_16]